MWFNQLQFRLILDLLFQIRHDNNFESFGPNVQQTFGMTLCEHFDIRCHISETIEDLFFQILRFLVYFQYAQGI